jgi:hypothetical protein
VNPTPTSPPEQQQDSTESPTVPAQPAVNQFLSGLPRYSLALAESDANSPQAQALAWLQDDPLYHEYELDRLYQRYALAVLYHSTSGESWYHSEKWLTNEDECTWYTHALDNICNDAHHLRYLFLHLNDLVGSIPTELELFTDLEYTSFGDVNLTGTVYSEL